MGAEGPEKPPSKIERLPAAERLIKQFKTLLENSKDLARRTQVETSAQLEVMRKLANSVREAGEAMDDLHGVIEEPDAGEGNARILQGAHQSYAVLRDAFDAAKRTLDEPK